MPNWRSRIGLVKPTHRGKSFAFWYQHMPDGVEIVPTFIGFRKGTRDTFMAEDTLRRAEELATNLREVNCDIVIVSGTPPFLLHGLETEERWAQQLSEKLGIPIVTAVKPHALALNALGAKRVAVATYFRDELNNGIVKHFSAFGLESVVIPGYSLNSQIEDLYATPLMALDDVRYDQVFRHCKQGVRALKGRVDALYINGGGWDAGPAIEYLESDLGIPVVWAAVAEMWQTYRTLGICDPIEGCGILLRDPAYRRS